MSRRHEFAVIISCSQPYSHRAIEKNLPKDSIKLCSPTASNICSLTNSRQLFTALSVRLQGPLSANGTGRIEVLHKGKWGTVCDEFWTINNAKVACRQLGYPYAVRALPGYLVPDGTGQIWLDNVGCAGNEQSLSSCYHRGWGVHDCGHNDDAGVECSSTGIIVILILRYYYIRAKT